MHRQGAAEAPVRSTLIMQYTVLGMLTGCGECVCFSEATLWRLSGGGEEPYLVHVNNCELFFGTFRGGLRSGFGGRGQATCCAALRCAFRGPREEHRISKRVRPTRE